MYSTLLYYTILDYTILYYTIPHYAGAGLRIRDSVPLSADCMILYCIISYSCIMFVLR